MVAIKLFERCKGCAFESSCHSDYRNEIEQYVPDIDIYNNETMQHVCVGCHCVKSDEYDKFTEHLYKEHNIPRDMTIRYPSTGAVDSIQAEKIKIVPSTCLMHKLNFSSKCSTA